VTARVFSAGLLLTALGALTACGTVHAASVLPLVRASASPRQEAVADADSMLESFVPPAGAQRVAKASALARAPETIGSPDAVYSHAFWLVKGQPKAVLAGLSARLPHRFSEVGSGVYGTREWFESFGLPDVPGVLTERTLLISVASAGGGQTAIRVDAQVVWVPAKSGSERVPSAATAVTITGIAGLGQSRTTRSATITSPATLQRIIALVDGLKVARPGEYSCPIDTGRELRLTFTRGRGGPVVATVTADMSGCGMVSMTTAGKARPALAGGETLSSAVLSAAGLRWPGFASG